MLGAYSLTGLCYIVFPKKSVSSPMLGTLEWFHQYLLTHASGVEQPGYLHSGHFSQNFLRRMWCNSGPGEFSARLPVLNGRILMWRFAYSVSILTIFSEHQVNTYIYIFNVHLWFVNAPWIKLIFPKINSKCPLNKATVIFFGPKPRFAQMGLKKNCP